MEIPENELIVLGGYIRQIAKRTKHRELNDSLSFLSDKNLGILGVLINLVNNEIHKCAEETTDQMSLF